MLLGEEKYCMFIQLFEMHQLHDIKLLLLDQHWTNFLKYKLVEDIIIFSY